MPVVLAPTVRLPWYVVPFYLVLRSFCRYFFTGQPLRGGPRDNATLLHEATEDLRGKPTEKLSGPIWHRLARRWSILGVPVLLLVTAGVAWVWVKIAVSTGAHDVPAWTLWPWVDIAEYWLAGAVGAIVVLGVEQLAEYLQTRRAVEEFVYPAWEAACDAMGYKFRPREARRRVILPDDFDTVVAEAETERAGWFGRLTDAAVARLGLDKEPEPTVEGDVVEPSGELVPTSQTIEMEVYRPPWWRFLPRRDTGTAEEVPEDEPVKIFLIPGKCSTTAEQNRIKQKVGPVVGMPDPIAVFELKGNHPYVLLTPNHPPPLRVVWEDIRRYAEATDIDHPVIGMAYGRRVQTMDFVDESPHSLWSGASGTGKTTVLKLGLSQRMHLGGEVWLFDFKVVSHLWAIDLPGCTYVSGIVDMHEQALKLGELVEYRKNNAKPFGWKLGQPLNTWPTLDIVMEESNALADALQTYWAEIRTDGEPRISPAVTALRSAAFMGRQFGIFIWAAAQQATARIFGAAGGEVRESFQARYLAKPSIQVWRMLAGGVRWQRFPAGPRGIWCRIQNGEVAFFRVPWMEDQEAHDWALSGIPSPGQPGYGDDVLIEGETITVTQVPVEPTEVTLDAAVALLPGPRTTKAALQKAAQRSGFPPRVGTGKRSAGLYELAALRQWRLAHLDSEVVAELEDQFGSARRGPGVIYCFWVHVNGERRRGYIGKSRRLDPVTGMPVEREEEHRGNKPFADLFEDDPEILWRSDDCSDIELGRMEEHYIATLYPLYNIEFQLGAEHAVPKWTQIEERHARDAAAGRPLWAPRDVYAERRG